MEKLLSVVIPVYKVEKYINKCLDSLLVPMNQLELLDIVIVNDGSPDKSAYLAREYEKTYPGIFRVIDKDNGGHGSAWNKGVELAEGKYLSFLDSDDWYDTTQFSQLIEVLRKCDTDLVLMNSTKYYAYQDKQETVALKNMEPGVVYNTNTYDWLHSGNGPYITYAPSTVYRTVMMQKYHPVFCEHVMYDDIILQVMPIMVAESFIYVHLNVYHYLIGRPGQSFDPVVRQKRANDVTTVLKQVVTFIRDNRDIAPLGSTRREWSDNLYSSFCTYHYVELSLFSYMTSKQRLQAWDSYVRESFPDIKMTKTVRVYRSAPFFFYFAWFKIGHLWRRILNRLKRDIGKE